jgi:hypothetical protein
MFLMLIAALRSLSITRLHVGHLWTLSDRDLATAVPHREQFTEVPLGETTLTILPALEAL